MEIQISDITKWFLSFTFYFLIVVSKSPYPSNKSYELSLKLNKSTLWGSLRETSLFTSFHEISRRSSRNAVSLKFKPAISVVYLQDKFPVRDLDIWTLLLVHIDKEKTSLCSSVLQISK